MTTQCETDLLSGVLSHVAMIAKQRTGRKPSPATIWRWCKKGLRGGSIRLQAIYHGGYWQTTDAAFNEFLKRQTDAALSQAPADDVSDDELRAAGLL